MRTYTDLQKQLHQLQAQLEEVTKREREAAIADIKKKMMEFGISASELGTARRSPRKAAPRKAANKKARTASKKASTTLREVRYRDPISGATWSGRGRVPRWIAGKDREQFAVKH